MDACLAERKASTSRTSFFLVTDAIAQGDLEVRHKGTEEMWADYNTKPLQGLKFRVMRAEMMGIPVEYDDDVERRRTHPLLLPKDEANVVSVTDGEILEKMEIIKRVPAGTCGAFKLDAPEEGTTRDGNIRSISCRADGPTSDRRSVLELGKYGPGPGPSWRSPVSRFPALTKSLVEEANHRSVEHPRDGVSVT